MATQPTLPTYELPQVKRLPVSEKPATRAMADVAHCSNAELLAVLIGGSLQIEAAGDLLTRFGSLQSIHHAHPFEMSVNGVGDATATRIKAALELGKRMTMEKPERPVINSPADAAALVMDMGLLEHEHLKVIVLDRRNKVMDIVEIYRGSVSSSQIRIAEVFRPAIRMNASSIIPVHNHPSGEVFPSPDDVAVTRAFVNAGKMMDIEIIDHLIICAGGRWTSLKERGLGFS
ncbi:MAG: DNA repair protein RadC [Anaerolineales bacterium]